MSDRPVIFISYSHKDEPDPFLQSGEFRWLTYVRSFLDPAAAHGKVELWDDRQIDGGGDWKAAIDEALARCTVCVFLVSRHSLSSRFILDIEMKAMLERHHARGAHLYPILVTSTDIGVAPWLLNLNLKPSNAVALELYDAGHRNKIMSELAAEIRHIVDRVMPSDAAAVSTVPQTETIDLESLPLTPYRNLVGRDYELTELDHAWADRKTNIVSVIAWGGAGKTALVNEWLKRLQADNYRGASAVLGWSFYDQGTKERTTAADQFLDWALEKLGVKVDAPSATVKGERLAELLAKRRILLILDGVEPLQHGPGGLEGLLKDQGLRSLLRRFAAMPPARVHGLIVIMSRAAVRDIEQYRRTTGNAGSSHVLDLAHLSAEAGAALLEDNGVQGSRADLCAAAQDFEGHALALSLLASLLVRRHNGDVRRRDRVGPLLQKTDARGHDHARRVMQAYESEWLGHEPVLRAILYLVGLFDRPATSGCIEALRRPPALEGLTDSTINLNADAWADAVAALRDVRLLDPEDSTATGVLDAHPLVREWFGQQLRERNSNVWQEAHGRIYEHLRDTTKEGERLTLESLGPLYQAIIHACKAGRYSEALEEVLKERIFRRKRDGALAYYSTWVLGAMNSDLAAVGWFFERPYEIPIADLPDADALFVLGIAAYRLSALGRFDEALPAHRRRLDYALNLESWTDASISAENIAMDELVLGNMSDALAAAKRAAEIGKKLHRFNEIIDVMACHAQILLALAAKRLRRTIS